MASGEPQIAIAEANGGWPDVELREQTSLDAFDDDTRVAVDTFVSAASKSQDTAIPSPELLGLARLATKALYDYGLLFASPGQSEAFSELYVDGFDTEQIWSQLDAKNSLAVRQLKKKLKNLPADIQLLDPNTDAMLNELLGDLPDEELGDSSEDDSAVQDADLEGSEDDFEGSEELGEGSSEESDPETSLPRAGLEKKRAQRKTLEKEEEAGLLPTEDQFLRLEDMERFVQDAEAAAMRAAREEADQEGVSGEEDKEGESDLEGLDPSALGSEGDEASGSEDEEDAELARMLESASDLVGKERLIRRSKRAESPDDDPIMYEDFFGPRNRAGTRNEPNGDLIEEDELPEGDLSEEEGEGDEDGELEGSLGSGDALEVEAAGLEDVLGNPSRSLAAEESLGKLSGHERRMRRMADRAQKLEAENLGGKEWFMRGEAGAASRPLNSALEVDLDFERALQPPPQPTEETTNNLEELIKRRIAERHFDDPARLATPSDELPKELAQLDDRRPSKGLGDIYEEEFVRAKTGNVLDDKDEKTRSEAKMVLKELFAKLDALSHFHFAPKPIIQDPAIRKEVPALAMEEVAPQVVSEAARKLPEEVYKAPKEAAQPDSKKRRTARAAKKRAHQKHKKQQDAEKKQNTARASGNIIGRKSEAGQKLAEEAQKRVKKKRKRSDGEVAPKLKYTKSAAVFGKIQDERDAKNAPQKASANPLKASQLKL